MKKDNKAEYKKLIFIAITIIALGTTMLVVFPEHKPTSIVMIGIGGLAFIAGMKRKNDNNKKN